MRLLPIRDDQFVFDLLSESKNNPDKHQTNRKSRHTGKNYRLEKIYKENKKKKYPSKVSKATLSQMLAMFNKINLGEKNDRSKDNEILQNKFIRLSHIESQSKTKKESKKQQNRNDKDDFDINLLAQRYHQRCVSSTKTRETNYFKKCLNRRKHSFTDLIRDSLFKSRLKTNQNQPTSILEFYEQALTQMTSEYTFLKDLLRHQNDFKFTRKNQKRKSREISIKEKKRKSNLELDRVNYLNDLLPSIVLPTREVLPCKLSNF